MLRNANENKRDKVQFPSKRNGITSISTCVSQFAYCQEEGRQHHQLLSKPRLNALKWLSSERTKADESSGAITRVGLPTVPHNTEPSRI